MKFNSEKEVFIHVVSNLLRQGERCTIIDEYCTEVCVYRSNTNKDLRCAGGWCIDDDEYQANFEGKHISALIPKYLDHLGPYINIISSLQTIHDDHYNDLVEEAQKVSHQYDLGVDVSKIAKSFSNNSYGNKHSIEFSSEDILSYIKK